jgi:hypothetical protein
MPILDTILAGPADTTTLAGKATTLENRLDAAFANFLYYAKRHWSYVASSTSGGDALLAGTANSAPCGGVATALKKVFIDGIGVADNDVEYITIAGYLWTGPGYSCFDPKVMGNLRKLDTPGVYSNGCIFNQHFYLKCSGKYYDPCLSTSYAMKDQCVKERFDANTATFSLGQDRRRLMVTADKRTCILYMPAEPVPGFQGAYTMFDATKKNLEKALGTAYFKAEMAAKHGAAKFQTFVSTLP